MHGAYEAVKRCMHSLYQAPPRGDLVQRSASHTKFRSKHEGRPLWDRQQFRVKGWVST